KEGNGDGGWNIKEIAKRQEGESDLEMRQRIKEAINERLPTLELNKKQNHHILGHKGYIEGRSYYEQPLDEEKIRELIRNGSVSIKKGKPWDEKIIIEHPDFEGVVLPHKKTSVDKPIRTRRSKVHFGNNGFHIVPYVGRKGRK
uniref:polymorphic toxin type 50 domain-containing protein n=2 Tax=Helicobacter bizzozeronii TaxID=56877 RepID=UPI001B323DE8